MSLSACSAPFKAGPLATPKVVDGLASDQSFVAPAAPFPQDIWWDRYNDPALSALIEEGLRNAPDLAAAAARVASARALAGEARSALRPTLSVKGGVSGERLSQNQIFPADLIPNDVQWEGTLTAHATFDLDLWGKNRAALAAATSEARAAEVDAAQARLLLTTAIAEGYFDLARWMAREEVARSAQRVADDTEQLTAQRVAQGLETDGALAQARARAAGARGETLALTEAVATARHALAALVGAGPDRGLTIVQPQLLAAAPLGLPERLAANLLGRRPDLVAARLRAEAAASRIKAARAAYFPDINLSAMGGVQSVGLDSLFQSSSAVTAFGPAIYLPLFQGGALDARYRGARAGYRLVVAHYDGILLGALREVADLVARKRLLADRLAAGHQAVTSGQRAYQVMALRYRNGIANQLELLAAEDAMLAAQAQLVTLKALDVVTEVALIRALGGGYGDAGTKTTESGQ